MPKFPPKTRNSTLVKRTPQSLYLHWTIGGLWCLILFFITSFHKFTIMYGLRYWPTCKKHVMTTKKFNLLSLPQVWLLIRLIEIQQMPFMTWALTPCLRVKLCREAIGNFANISVIKPDFLYQLLFSNCNHSIEKFWRDFALPSIDNLLSN